MPAARSSANIALRTFVFARWVLLGLIALGWTVQLLHPPTWVRIINWFPPPPEPRGTGAVMIVLVALNLATQRWILKPGKATPNIAGAHLMIDATALTALLALSGGVSNPFTTMFFVPITLATQISPRWMWTLALYCLAGFAALFLVSPGVGAVAGHGEHLSAHIRGMWVAFAISGTFMTYFVHRIAMSLARQRGELARLREEALQDRNLAALGTLAAGAAHELGSPLGTISALVGDLDYMGEDEREESITTIKQQVRRCKHIIHQMASPELRLPQLGREVDAWSLRDLEDELVEAAVGVRVRVVFTPAVRPPDEVRQPREVIGQILRELVSNAAAACRNHPGAREVVARFDVLDGEVFVEVVDDGVGMDEQALARAFNPFYSTKEEGRGMGLGLYLARAHLRQLGGSIELESSPDRGTKARVRFPVRPQHATLAGV
ncbi:MAG: HAMP domain-containing histidine kinase [Myxococcales bacterium]|nr:HAMP domain-containing histidine kinase [Myxococcales bacterium]MCB9749317.1 HAMP domain-containing histidine kinase [Myxococcales bacterium]